MVFGGDPGRDAQEHRARRAVARASCSAVSAAQYILLAAEFVAITQVLVYLGAIVVLFLFGIMLTRAQIGRDADLDNTGPAGRRGDRSALLLFGLMGYALVATQLPRPGARHARSCSAPPQVSDSIFSTYLIPFEVVSVLLLAALIGAIVLARTGLMLINQFLLLGAILFCIGVYGVLARRNGVLVLMSIELILNAVNINLVAFGAIARPTAIAGPGVRPVRDRRRRGRGRRRPGHRAADLPQPPAASTSTSVDLLKG